MRTKEPTLRITKWLKAASIPGSDIPLEAECTACPDVHFETPFSLRSHLAKPFTNRIESAFIITFVAHSNYTSRKSTP